MRKLVILGILCFIAALILPPALAATCGDSNAQGNEQCDGQDLRGYACRTLCYLDPAHLADYESDSSSYHSGGYPCYDGGTLACNGDCTLRTSGCYYIHCGDGDLQGAEECDDGSQNSDSVPDACRTDCTLASCGDGVVDSGEQCDDGPRNSDQIPDACRSDCTLASCGDGVIDVVKGEECDDDFGQCFKCRRCVEPVDNLHIREDTTLCSGTYQIADQGAEGVIIVDGHDVTVDCRDVWLYGVPMQLEQLAPSIPSGEIQGMQAGQQNQQGWPGGAGLAVQKQGLFSKMFGFVKNLFGTGEAEPPTNNPPLGQAVSEIKQGVGILVSGDENVLVGCEVHNYRYGVKVTGQHDLLGRIIACQNNNDITGEGAGSVNTCGTGTWHDLGYERCTYTCAGGEGTAVDDACPACPICPEEEPGTPPEQERPSEPETPPEEAEPELVECPDGSTAESEEECPEVCPGVTCPTGECVKAKWECDPYECWDGSLVEYERDCPSLCARDEYECDDGSCVDETWECDPYVCDDGSEVESASDCPPSCADYACDDGRCVKAKWECDPFTCKDGSLVASEEECPDYCAGYTCDDGSCVKSEGECLVCCKTIGGLAAPIVSYNEVTLSQCSKAGGQAVADSFCVKK